MELHENQGKQSLNGLYEKKENYDNIVKEGEKLRYRVKQFREVKEFIEGLVDQNGDPVDPKNAQRTPQLVKTASSAKDLNLDDFVISVPQYYYQPITED